MAHARVYADRMDYLADRMIRGRGNAAVLRAEWKKAWALWVRANFGIAP